jgi:predicted ATPase/DNA-binding SARP family transcriptional activator
MEFRILGPIEATADGGRALDLGGPKPRALLAHLLLGAGRPISRDALVDELWGERPPPTARDSLNVHAGLLRRALGKRLRTVSGGYQVEVGVEELDATRFEARVEAVRSHAGDPAETAQALSLALGLWRGPVFGGIPVGPTAGAAGARLEELRLTALENRVEADLALGRHLDLVPELTGLLASNPSRERVAGHLMLALHRSGRSADALAVYAATCRVLDAELGVDPGEAFTQLSRAIHRDDPTLAAPGPPLFPSMAGRFIGRREELERAGELLASSRLLTLSGVGGCGKTRLGLELARMAAPAQPGGVFLADLGPLGPGASVSRQVAAILGVRERRGASLVSLLATRLRHHRALLVLDNCEHLVEGCAELCSQLLEMAPGLRILATSREPLGISGEVVFTVPGLGVPDAVRLLVDRAASARPGFALAPADADVASALCRRLDGLPLAIELAAARMSSLSLQEVASRVDERLDALGGSRSVAARHRTMRASIEWSHELLDESERVVFRRLGVFAGGFSSDAARAVAGGWEPLARDADVLGVCGRLVDKSMLVFESGPERTGYRMLEIVRQFSAEQLAQAGEGAATSAHHASWYHSFVPDAKTWGGPDQPLWMDRLRREVDNVHAALAWYFGEGWDAERALEMAGRMWFFWYMAGRVGEGRIWLSRALAATSAEPRATRGLAVRGAAALCRITGDFVEALRLGEESLSISRSLGDERGVAAALNNLCITAMMTGDLGAARLHGEQGLELIERSGDHHGIATSLNNLGLVARISGDLDRALDLFTKARANYGLGSDRRGLAAALSNLAIVRRRRDETSLARELAIEALRLYTDLGFDEGQLDCLEAIAAIAAATGASGEALRLLNVTMRSREELGSPLFVPDELAQVTDALETARGALDEAEIERISTESHDLTLSDAVLSVLG